MLKYYGSSAGVCASGIIHQVNIEIKAIKHVSENLIKANLTVHLFATDAAELKCQKFAKNHRSIRWLMVNPASGGFFTLPMYEKKTLFFPHAFLKVVYLQTNWFPLNAVESYSSKHNGFQIGILQTVFWPLRKCTREFKMDHNSLLAQAFFFCCVTVKYFTDEIQMSGLHSTISTAVLLQTSRILLRNITSEHHKFCFYV